jgi:hypothetical protein
VRNEGDNICKILKLTHNRGSIIVLYPSWLFFSHFNLYHASCFCGMGNVSRPLDPAIASNVLTASPLLFSFWNSYCAYVGMLSGISWWEFDDIPLWLHTVNFLWGSVHFSKFFFVLFFRLGSFNWTIFDLTHCFFCLILYEVFMNLVNFSTSVNLAIFYTLGLHSLVRHHSCTIF